jgi:hypothetical protein
MRVWGNEALRVIAEHEPPLIVLELHLSKAVLPELKACSP